MTTEGLIIYHGAELLAGTWAIAQGLGREHKNILELFSTHRVNFEKLGCLKTHKLPSTGGRPVIEYLLNKAQCLLLFGLFRTQTKRKMEFFIMLIQSFEQAGKTLKEILQAFDSFDFDNINVRYVYAAQDSLGRIKIGISNNPERRLRELNIGNADELKLIYTKETERPRYGDEVDIHNMASEYCIRSEWFQPEATKFLQ